MIIRKYIDDDLASLLSCWEHASAVGHPFLSAEFLSTERVNIPALYLKNGQAWVAELNGSMAGFMILHSNEVGALFVNPQFHKMGIGSALMNKARAIYADLEVEVFRENAVGRKFYLNYGFNFIREYFHEETGMIMQCLKYESKLEQ